MTFFKSLMVALSTYSIIPAVQFEWNEKNMKYSMCFFPVVGVICGVLVWLVSEFGTAFSHFFTSALTVCIPIIVSGGIHMDGFMDTVDALSSHAPKDKKLEILSDPHIGAFSVIYMAVYLVLAMSVVYEIHSLGALLPLCPVYVLSRSMSALCAINMPNARKSGMLSTYTKDAKKIVVNITMVVVSIASAAVMVIISPLCGALAVIMGMLWTVLYCILAKKEFGGVTGDTAGFFLQVFELTSAFGILIGAMI